MNEIMSNLETEMEIQKQDNTHNSKSNLYMFQFSFLYGNEIYLPYSAGILWSYARTIQDIKNNIENKGFRILREEPETIVGNLENSDIAAFSTYVWNFEMSVAVARIIKERFPKCLIVFGGPQVPDPERLEDFFEKYPFIDITVHGEGEITFSEILLAHINKTDFKKILGLTYRGTTTDIRPRTRDLNIFPSPYLTGVFDELLEIPYHYQTVWETNRGCPYGCTFCDWGSMTAQKLFQFDDERIFKEMELFAKKKVNHVYMSDANFGILPRDVEIARRIAKINEENNGYPKKIRVNFAKNNKDRVFEIAKIFNKQKMDKGITLSVQSMDPTTLETIKRKNLKFDTLSSFMKKYEAEQIDTVVELIIGLPGETYQSFKNGINTLLDNSAHNSLWIYRCTLLPNAPMNYAGYKKQHEIKTIRTPIELNHTVPGKDPVQEYENTIYETTTTSREDMIKTLLLSWSVSTFHALGLLQVIAVFSNRLHNMEFSTFYESLLNYAEQNPNTILGQEYCNVKKIITNALTNGSSWENVVLEYSEQTWSLEEASFLRIMLKNKTFYLELVMFMKFLQKTEGLNFDKELSSDILKYQEAVIVKSDDPKLIEFKVNSSIHSFFRNHLVGNEAELTYGEHSIKISNPYDFNDDKNQYSTEIVFWGRRGGKPIHSNIEELNLVNTTTN
jgi:putative methyltransferase